MAWGSVPACSDVRTRRARQRDGLIPASDLPQRIDGLGNQWQRRGVKAKQVRREKPSPGTVLAAKYRTRANLLRDADRARLGDEFLRLYYGRPAPAARRR